MCCFSLVLGKYLHSSEHCLRCPDYFLYASGVFFLCCCCCWSFYSLARLFWRSHSVCHIRGAAYSAVVRAALEPAVCLTDCWRGEKRGEESAGRLATGPSSLSLSVFLSLSPLSWPLSSANNSPIGSRSRYFIPGNLLFSN